MNFKDFEKLKQRYSDKVSETEDTLKVLDKEIEDKALLSNKNRLQRMNIFTGLSYAVLLFITKNEGIISPDILSLIFPLVAGSFGYLINKGYESIFVNNGKDNLKTTETVLEEEFEKCIEEELAKNVQLIYVQCNNNFYAKEQIGKKFNKMSVNSDYVDSRSVNEIKEQLVALNVLLDENKELLRNLCAKKMMLEYFNEYDSKRFLKIKEFFKTNIATLITLLGTSVFFALNDMPIDILSVLVSSSIVGTYYGVLLNKSNSDNLNVYDSVKEKYDFKGLEEYKTLEDIACKIQLLVAETSKIKTMIDEEEIYLEEKTSECINYPITNLEEKSNIKHFIRVRRK